MSGIGGAVGGGSPQQFFANIQDTLERKFEEFDVNGDGAVSRSEFAGQMRAGGPASEIADRIFGQLDADHDGSVSESERDAGIAAFEQTLEQLSGLLGGNAGASFDLASILLDGKLLDSLRDDQPGRERTYPGGTENLAGKSASATYLRAAGL